LLGSDREELGIGLGIRITDLNQIVDLNLTSCLCITYCAASPVGGGIVHSAANLMQQ